MTRYLTLVFILALAACGGETESQSDNDSTSTCIVEYRGMLCTFECADCGLWEGATCENAVTTAIEWCVKQ